MVSHTAKLYIKAVAYGALQWLLDMRLSETGLLTTAMHVLAAYTMQSMHARIEYLRVIYVLLTAARATPSYTLHARMAQPWGSVLSTV